MTTPATEITNPAAVLGTSAAAPPAATPPVAIAAPAATPAAAPPAAPAVPEVDPVWLKARLERERASGVKDALKASGFASVEDAKTAADAAKATADANKTATERAAELKAQLDAKTSEAAALGVAANEWAGRMMGGLTEAQRTAVKAIAGDDPSLQMKTISALQPTWSAQDAAVATATAEAAAKAAAAAPTTVANTAPTAGAPSGAAPVLPPERATYESIKATNPFAAAQYGLDNPGVYAQK